MSESELHLALTDAFFKAIEAGDIEAVRAAYAPEATIWHNTDDYAQPVSENLWVLTWLTRHLADRHYQIIRRVAIPGGVFQQHVLTGTMIDGVSFSMPAAIVLFFKDSQIIRIEEYLDSRQSDALANAAS